MFDLTGKTALVTGATGGIGGAIARALHAQGALVILTGRNEGALQALVSELGSRAYGVAADLADKSQLETLLDRGEELAGSVDILVCNAGIARDNLALRMKAEEWGEVIDTNLTAPFLLNRAAFKKMMKKRWGRIINITSVVAITGNPGQANYTASKAGLIGMSKSIAAECASRGITVNCIAPGFIRTAMTDALNQAQQEKITASIPGGKFGLPEDIAAAVVYLASDEAGYVTGQTLHVNGGMVMV